MTTHFGPNTLSIYFVGHYTSRTLYPSGSTVVALGRKGIWDVIHIGQRGGFHEM